MIAFLLSIQEFYEDRLIDYFHRKSDTFLTEMQERLSKIELTEEAIAIVTKMEQANRELNDNPMKRDKELQNCYDQLMDLYQDVLNVEYDTWYRLTRKWFLLPMTKHLYGTLIHNVNSMINDVTSTFTVQFGYLIVKKKQKDFQSFVSSGSGLPISDFDN